MIAILSWAAKRTSDTNPTRPQAFPNFSPNPQTAGVANAKDLAPSRGPQGDCRFSAEAPRAGLNCNRGFVELGTYIHTRLERKPVFTFYAWNNQNKPIEKPRDPGQRRHDPLRLARYYQ